MRDKKNDELLRQAAKRGDVEATNLLLQQGANIDAADNSGETPLHIAAFNSSSEVGRVLLERGANIEAADKAGWTPLHYAAQKGHSEVVKVLLDAKANIDAADKGGRTPLNYAAQWGHSEVVKILLEQGANKDAADNYGNTPLHDAAFNGRSEMVKALLEKGALVSDKIITAIRPTSPLLIKLQKAKAVQEIAKSLKEGDSVKESESLSEVFADEFAVAAFKGMIFAHELPRNIAHDFIKKVKGAGILPLKP